MIRFLTAGESHGKGLTAILEGLPAHLALSSEDIDKEISRRQAGHGRGGRMKIETDRVEILSGVRRGRTLGSPITLWIPNKDHENWAKVMAPGPAASSGQPLKRPRPGHADLAGGLKYDHRDLRNILERASARETVLRVAAGAVAKRLLAEFGILVQSHVVRLGPVTARIPAYRPEDLNKLSDASPVRMLDKAASRKAVAAIDLAARRGDTWGGVFEVVATHLPAGLGSHVQWDRKLDGRLARAIMSIQAVKGVEIGQAFAQSAQSGSRVHDEIFWSKRLGFHHRTNRAGGIEGGISNGEPVIVRAAMKPISTLKTPLRSVHIDTKAPLRAGYERSDTCALPAAAVIGEAACAWVLADALLEKIGGDHMGEIRARILSLRRDHAGF